MPATNYQIKTLNISRLLRPENTVQRELSLKVEEFFDKNVLLMLENLIKLKKGEVSDFFRAVRR